MWDVDLDASTRHPVSARGEAAGAPVLGGPEVVRWSLAYGSNANPERLIDKGLDVRGAILLPAVAPGLVTAWEARRTTSTGAIPLTLLRQGSRLLNAWVLGLHVDDLATLDISEGRGTNYLLGEAGPVAVADCWLLAPALAYGPTTATRLLAERGLLAEHPARDHAHAGRLLDDPLGVHLGADPLPGVIEADWPQTPLVDLDLFVYGTLQPGLERWERIADLVQVVGEAWVAGTCVDTFYGWPALTLTEGTAERVHGHLLRPRDAASAVELFRRTDAIEDVPDLFLRRTVPVHSGEGQWWAVAYEWNPAQGPAPGTRVPDGRWSPA